jgi:hypothetical protein
VNEFKFQLGETVKDSVTNFTGVILARAQHMTNCNTYGVSPTKVTKEGKRPDCEWFDEPRLVAQGKPLMNLEPKRKTGGPSCKSEVPPLR